MVFKSFKEKLVILDICRLLKNTTEIKDTKEYLDTYRCAREAREAIINYYSFCIECHGVGLVYVVGSFNSKNLYNIIFASLVFLFVIPFMYYGRKNLYYTMQSSIDSLYASMTEQIKEYLK